MFNGPLLFLALMLLLALLSPLKGLWPLDWLTAVLAILPMAVLFGWLRGRRHDSRTFSLPPGSVALLCLIGWGILQIVPLPPAVVKVLSPRAWQLYAESVMLLDPESWMTLSLHPKSTLESVIFLCSGTSFYFLSVFLLTDHHRLKQGVLWLTGIGGGLAVGMIGFQVGALLSGGRHEPAGLMLPDLTPFALLLLLLGPLAFSALLALRPTSRYGSLQERITTYWQTAIKDRFLIIAVAALIIPFGVSLWYWQAMFFYLAALFLLWVLLAFKGRGKRETPYIILLIVLILLATVVGFPSVKVGLRQEAVSGMDADGQPMTERLAADFFLTGSGLGTFERISQRYEYMSGDRQIASSLKSALLCVRVEGGLPVLVFSIWFLVALTWRSLTYWRRRRNKMAIYLVTGSLASLFAFSGAVVLLELPVPLWLSYYALALAGLMVAASQSSHRWPLADDFMPLNKQRLLFYTSTLVLCILTASLLFYIGAGMARWLTSDILVDNKHAAAGGETISSSNRLLSHAILYDPLNGLYQRELAWNFLKAGQPRKALAGFASALRLDPLAGRAAYRAGISMAETGHKDIADTLMQHGLRSDWHNQALQVDFVTRLLRRQGKRAALEHIRQILVVSPSKTLDWLYFLDQNGFSLQQGALILADDPRCLVDYGDYLLRHNKPGLALDSYWKALDYVQNSPSFSPQIIWRLAGFFEARELYEEVLAAFLAGTRVYPEDLDFLKASANLYERLGITFKAAEMYRQILMHAPQDLETRQKLEKLEDLRR